jgi:hypothetical protein
LATSEQASWRHFGSGVDGAEPGGESSDHPEPPSPSRTLYALRLHCPAERKLRGNELRLLALNELHKMNECSGRFTKFRTQSAPEGHILSESIPQRSHLSPPATGQGRATVRNASKDTWA